MGRHSRAEHVGDMHQFGYFAYRTMAAGWFATKLGVALKFGLRIADLVAVEIAVSVFGKNSRPFEAIIDFAWSGA